MGVETYLSGEDYRLMSEQFLHIAFPGIFPEYFYLTFSFYKM